MMNAVMIPLEKGLQLSELTPEQFEIVERSVIFDDLKDQYRKYRLELSFNLEQEIKDWLETVNSFQTERMYFVVIQNFLKYCNRDVLNITAKEADKYIVSLKNEGRAGSTVKMYTHAVSSFYTYLERMNRVKKNPFSNNKIKVDETPKDKYVPTEREIDLLEKKALKMFSGTTYVKFRIALNLMKNYGVRKGFLDNMKVKGNVLSSISKGKEYKVKLTNEEDIAYYNRDKDVFESLNSNSISKWFNDCVGELYREGKIGGKFSPHSMRHYFAVTWYNEHNGGRLEELRKLLNHESLGTTMIYLRSIGLEV